MHSKVALQFVLLVFLNACASMQGDGSQVSPVPQVVVQPSGGLEISSVHIAEAVRIARGFEPVPYDTHVVNLDWTFVVSGDGEREGLRRSKSGHCGIRFKAEVAKNYVVIAQPDSKGSWLEVPQVFISISERDGQLVATPRLVAKAPCAYSGRLTISRN